MGSLFLLSFSGAPVGHFLSMIMLFPAFSNAHADRLVFLGLLLYILFSPAYKIAIWDELGEEPENYFRKDFGSSLKKPGGQKWKECRWTEKKNSPSWNNIISPSLTNNFTFIPVFNTVALSLHTSSIGYFWMVIYRLYNKSYRALKPYPNMEYRSLFPTLLY